MVRSGQSQTGLGFEKGLKQPNLCLLLQPGPQAGLLFAKDWSSLLSKTTISQQAAHKQLGQVRECTHYPHSPHYLGACAQVLLPAVRQELELLFVQDDDKVSASHAARAGACACFLTVSARKSLAHLVSPVVPHGVCMCTPLCRLVCMHWRLLAASGAHQAQPNLDLANVYTSSYPSTCVAKEGNISVRYVCLRIARTKALKPAHVWHPPQHQLVPMQSYLGLQGYL